MVVAIAFALISAAVSVIVSPIMPKLLKDIVIVALAPWVIWKLWATLMKMQKAGSDKAPQTEFLIRGHQPRQRTAPMPEPPHEGSSGRKS